MQRFANAANWQLEQTYETRGPRSLKRGKKDVKESNRLPIKTASGIVVRHAAPPSPDTTDDESEEDEEVEEEAAEETVVESEEEKHKIPERQRVLEAKEELAKIASAVQEDPEENVCHFFSLWIHGGGGRC
jgi:nucleolar complex protein 3